MGERSSGNRQSRFACKECVSTFDRRCKNPPFQRKLSLGGCKRREYRHRFFRICRLPVPWHLCAGKLLFSYLHHQTLTFNHLTSAFIRHKTSYPNQVSGLCSQGDPPVSTDHADSYVTYPSYDIFCNDVEPYIFKKSIERLATFRNNLYLCTKHCQYALAKAAVRL